MNKMKIELAEPGARMAPSGEGVLRSLQNNSLPIVDLVIREAFQNSLDAAKEDSEMVEVNVSINDIYTCSISKYFQGIEDSLNTKYPKKTKVMAISDTHTNGLTGEFRTDDSEILKDSNIYKLIYGLYMNQTEKDAGGSWGLGKTSFFRLGAGIVIYYSRIKDRNGKFEERLAACLIEDKDSDNAIMPDNHRGIAWWGHKDTDDPFDKSYPITDNNIIKEILENLKIKRYQDKSTGTTIIIPFIQEDNLFGEDDIEESSIDSWNKSLEDAVRIAIQRWYSPRLLNPKYHEHYGQAYLVAKINDDLVFHNPISEKIPILYNSALDGNSDSEDISVENVYLKRLGLFDPKQPIGRVAYQRINRFNIEKYFHPLRLLGFNIKDKDTSGYSIMIYCRKPGMIVEYVLDSNEWMKGVHTEDNEIAIAFFVPNSNAKLHENYQLDYETLEEYLRKTENADHAEWKDLTINNKKVTIIERIKKEVTKVLATELGQSREAIISDRTSALSREYGNKYLPKNNFGKSGRPTKLNDPNRKKSKRPSFNVLAHLPIDKDSIKISGELNVPKGSKAQLIVEVASETGKINKKSWENIFGSSNNYPFEITDCQTNEEKINVEILSDDITIKVTNDNEDRINANLDFILKFLDPTLQPAFKVSTEQ